MARDLEKAKANTRKRYAANPEKFRAASRERYIRNRAACIASTIAWQKAHPEKVKAILERRALPRRLKKYGLDKEQYDTLILKQENKCACCRCPKTKEWHIDHCHNTKKVRGLLCGSCNKALGLAKESAKILRRMADYIEGEHG